MPLDTETARILSVLGASAVARAPHFTVELSDSTFKRTYTPLT